jgi:predicted small integral membrane protein
LGITSPCVAYDGQEFVNLATRRRGTNKRLTLTGKGSSVIEARLAKIVMVASLAAFALLGAYSNVADYGTNFEFVRHVLSMDTIFPGSVLKSRAITTPIIWHIAYWIIIAGEGLTGFAFAAGTAEMAQSIRRDASQFQSSKRFVYIGGLLGFLIWFFAFMVLGGEWFESWQSKVWAGQESAFRIYMAVLGVLVFVAQRDDT